MCQKCWLLGFSRRFLSGGFQKVPYSNLIVTSLIFVLDLRDLVCPRYDFGAQFGYQGRQASQVADGLVAKVF